MAVVYSAAINNQNNIGLFQYWIHPQILREPLILIEKITDGIFIPLACNKAKCIFVDSFKQNLSMHKCVFVHSFHTDIVKIFRKGKYLSLSL